MRLRRKWLAAGGAVLAAAGATFWWTHGDDPRATGPLRPLAPLVGRWTDPDSDVQSTYAWGPEGHTLREERRDADGHEESRTYFWHPERTPEGGSLALLGVDDEGTVREGILRQDDEGCLELRWNAYRADGGGASYRERLRFLDEDRVVRTLHQKTEEQELLVEERTLRRR